MKKLYFLILFFFSLLQSQAQELIIALPAMNVIYIGLDNPIKIAVEGYKYNQLTISSSNCDFNGEYPNTYLRAYTVNPNGCSVFVSYQKENKTLTDTFSFRVKSIPRPEPFFGTLESGGYPAAALLGQNTIRAILPNFVFQGVSFKVTSYRWKFITRSGLLECSGMVNGSEISSKLKRDIGSAKSGDLIIIDSIKCANTDGFFKSLSPIEIYIDSKKEETKKPDLITYQKEGGEKISFYPFQPVFGCQREPLFEKGTLKLYTINLSDTILFSEIYITSNYLLHLNSNHIVYEKTFYPNGKIKDEYIFESNDSIGQATRYYENGQIMSEGNVIFNTKNISSTLQNSFYFAGVMMIEAAPFIQKYIDNVFAPIGNWKGYYQDGKIALDCNFKLVGYANLDYETDTTFTVRCGNHDVKFYSIIEALKHPGNSFYPALSGVCKTYDKSGKLLSEENFKE